MVLAMNKFPKNNVFYVKQKMGPPSVFKSINLILFYFLFLNILNLYKFNNIDAHQKILVSVYRLRNVFNARKTAKSVIRIKVVNMPAKSVLRISFLMKKMLFV